MRVNRQEVEIERLFLEANRRLERSERELAEAKKALQNTERETAEAMTALKRIALYFPTPTEFPTSTTFQERTMLPTIGGNTQVFTGTFTPAGSVPPADAVYAATSNDPAVSPTVDASGLVVTIPLPAGWVESATTPLAITRTASSVSVPTWTLSDVIVPSAPPAPLPTGTTFVQTT
jgi:hypothetical protein